jgi:GH18 family chitinase
MQSVSITTKVVSLNPTHGKVYSIQQQFLSIPFPDDKSVGYYMDWKGYQEEEDIKEAEKFYGCNKLVYNIAVSTSCFL